jgi:hypothetical protein
MVARKTADDEVSAKPADTPVDGLHELLRDAQHLEQQPEKPTPAEEQQASQARQEAEQAVGMLCAVVVQFLPDRYADRYGTKQQGAIVQAFGALCEARGWDVGEVLGRWGPELALGAALVMPALPVLMADAKAVRAAGPAPAEPVQQPQPAPPRQVREKNMADEPSV